MDSSHHRRVDGHRLTEFIYGTVMGMVAVAGMSAEHGTTWLSAAAIIIAGAVAIWVAHSYAQLFSKRIASGRRLEGHDLLEALRDSWPIVTAGILLVIPILPAAVGLWSMETALWGASVFGVVILAAIGVLAGVVSHETWSRRLLLAALSAGLGLAIVAVEIAVHH